jgi:hypothetical protein
MNSGRLRSPDMRRSPDSFYPGGGVVAEAGEAGGLRRPGVAGRELLQPVTEPTKNDVDRTPLAVHVTRWTRRSVGPRQMYPECALVP